MSNNDWEKNCEEEIDSSYFNEKENYYINKYSKYTVGIIDNKELNNIIKKCNYNDEKILNEINMQKKLIAERGDDYNWKEVKNKKQKKKYENENNNILNGSQSAKNFYGKKNYSYNNN